MDAPVAFRNVARYVRDVPRSVPLYEALGFQVVRATEGFAILQGAQGLRLVLHGWEREQGPNLLDTALGFTMVDNRVEEARAHLEKAGWNLLRAPDAEDEGFFYIYGDLDGNPINLVGERPRPA